MFDSTAIRAALSESSMKTMALTEETVPRRTQFNVLCVVSRSRPQSSALTMSEPAHDVLTLPAPGSAAAVMSLRERALLYAEGRWPTGFASVRRFILCLKVLG